MKILPTFRFRAGSNWFLVLALANFPLQATTITWDAGGTNGLWSTGTNWDTDTEPNSTHTVVFPVGLAGTITLAAGELALALQFDDNYTLSSGGLALATGNSIQVSSGAAPTINTPLNVTGGLTKTGTGTLILGGSNTNPGGTVISAGKIRAAHIGALGAAAAVTTVNGGAILEVANSITLDRSVTLMQNGTVAGIGTATNTGKITIDALATSVTLATDALTDVFTIGNGANDLTGGSSATTIGISGPGAVRLGAASDFDGSWNLPAGRLELASATALGDQASSWLTLAGGTLSARLSTATAFTGSPGNNLTVTADSTILSDRASASAGVTHTFGSLAMGSHTLTVAPGSNATSGTAGITLGNLTLTGNPVFAVDDLAAANGKLTTGSLLGGAVARTITKTGAGDLAVTGGSTDLPAGSVFSATGGGTIEMLFPNLGATTPAPVSAAQNPFGEATLSVTDGSLRLLADGNGSATAQTYEIPSAITLGGTVTLDPDRRSGSNTNKTFDLVGLTLAPGTALSMSGDNTHGIRLTGPLALQGDATLQGTGTASKDGLLTLNGGISGTTTDELTLNGGTSTLNLTINAGSTYGGGTTMNGGNVTLNAASALGTGPVSLTGGTLTVNTDGALADDISILGGTLRVNDIDALAATPVQLGGGTLDLRSNTSATVSIGTLAVSGTSTLNFANNGSGSNLVLTAPSLAINGNTTLTVSVANSFIPNFPAIALAGNLTFSQSGTARIQSITEDASARTFIKTGTGTTQLQGASTHSGGTEVLAGILSVEHSLALGSGALTLGATSGTATATAQFTTGLTIANDLVVRAGSSGTATFDSPSGGVTWNGALELQKNVTLDNGSSTVSSAFNGTITGTGDIIKTSAGEIALGSAANSFGSGTGGSVTVNDGTITVASDGALGNPANGVTLAGTDGTLKIDGTFSSSRTLAFTGSSSTGVNVAGSHEFTMNSPLTGTGTMIKSGTGTMTIASGVDSSARGAATSGVTGGVLRVQNATALSSAGPVTLNGTSGTIAFLSDADTGFAHPVTANGTGTIHVDQAAGGTGTNGRHTLGTLAMASGNLTVTGANGYGLTLGASSVTFDNTITNNAPGALELASLTGTPGSSTLVMTLGGSGDIHLTGALAEGAGTGNYRLTKTGAGTLRLGSSVAEFGNLTTVRDGTLDLNGLSYEVTDLTLGGASSTLGARIVTGAGSIELVDALTFSSSTSPPGAQITGNLGLGALPHVFTINDSGNAPVDLTIDGPIGGSSGASFTKAGAGTLRLSGAGNTQPGLVTVTSGVLEMAKSSGDAIGGGGLDITGGTARLAAGEQVQNAAAVTIASANDAFLDLNGYTETTGPLALTQTDPFDYSAVKTGAAGTLVLAGNLSLNNNCNSTAADARNILITGTGTDFTAASDGTLDLGGAVRTIHVATTTVGANEALANATIETRIINGGILKTGARNLHLTNPDNTFSGGLQIAEGTVVPGSGSSLGTGMVSFANAGAASASVNLGTITGTITNDFTIGGSGTGSSTITYSAAAPNVLVLSGNFDLERDLTIHVAEGSTNNGDSAVLDMTGVIDDGTHTAGILKTGDGTLKLAAGNTYSGATTLQRGILSISADNALGDGTLPLAIDGGCLQATASFTMARDVVFGTGGGSVRVDSPALLEIPGSVTWDSGTCAFYGSGTTVLSGTTAGSGGDLLIGKPTEFAEVPFSALVSLGHVLSVRGSASLPAGQLQIVNNGILELGTGNFTRTLGTGPGEVSLPTAAGGGWAAHGADRSVNLGGASATVIWGQTTPPFLYNSGIGDLILGSATATHTVDFQNPIDFNNAAASAFRDLIVHDGPATLDARISGGMTQSSPTFRASVDLECAGTLEISGPVSGAIGLDKLGTGTVILSGNNTLSDDLNVYQGTMIISSDASAGTPEDIFIDTGAELDISGMTTPLGVAATDFISVYGTLTGDIATPSYFEGNGTVDGDLHALAGAYVFPDYNTSLHVTGDFTLDATATIDFFADGVVPLTEYNRMSVTGAVNLAGELLIGVSNIPEGYTDPIVMILNDGTDAINGSFAGLPEGAGISIGGGLALQVTYQANGDGGAVANDFGFTVVPDTFGSDLALSAAAPLTIDSGGEIVVSYTIDSPGPGLVTDGELAITLPANATLVSSNPTGTVNTGVLTIPLPALSAPGSTNVELRLTAPAATAGVTVESSVSSSASDPDTVNNSATTVTAVLPGGILDLAGFTTGAGNATLTLDTISGVNYAFQSSTDLTTWSNVSLFTGDGLPHEVQRPIDKPKEFFRFAIVP